MFERRREPRTEVHWPLQLVGTSGKGAGRVINASLCGVLLEVDIELKEQELAILRITPNGEIAIECVAEIQRSFAHDGNILYGAEFKHMRAADRQRLGFALLVQRQVAISGGPNGFTRA